LMGAKDSLSFQVFLYALCCVLVIVFVHLYSVYSLLNKVLPPEAPVILPIALVLFALFFVFFCSFRKKDQVYWPLLLTGILLCLGALIIPDSRYPVKRIHVLEYMLLSCLVRYAMSWKIQGAKLLFFSVVATAVFGIHDELLQGIHLKRTYGLRDMGVNGLSAFGGGLIWHGGRLFQREAVLSVHQSAANSSLPILYLSWLVASVFCFVVPLAGLKNQPIPYWTLLPLSAALLFWALYLEQFAGRTRHGCMVLSGLVFSFFCYPFVINAFSLTFY